MAQMTSVTVKVEGLEVLTAFMEKMSTLVAEGERLLAAIEAAQE